ncbi:hypothetical protein POM88_027814 [Heracleum sosnowskyi]|uniref:DUF7769 domain-containing protein n=1 Tax=Heracleum sosnowskyi TaxID=360622 RepID=A0AAD8IBR4_9APIA|nr:hypothetical protein POM88_027814 [Heracleum sosnowskyi]
MASTPIIPDLNEDPRIFDSIIPDLNEDPNIFDFNASVNTSIPASFIDTAKGKRLTNLEKKQICHMLSLNYNNNKLKKGIIKKIASDYAVSRMTIYTIWKEVLQSIKIGEHPNVQRKYKGGNHGYVLDLQQLPHIGKNKLQRLGQLPKVLTAPLDVVEKQLNNLL